MILGYFKNEELGPTKRELVSHSLNSSFSSVIDLNLWAQAKVWYETDRKLGKHSTSTKQYYLEFLEESLVNEVLHKEAHKQRPRQKDKI